MFADYLGTQIDISIPALREEGDDGGSENFRISSISIHALREEGDCCI